mmetsp:Transcript_52871/g.133566  ORF Transcript_52871/g.133566 Transcript_52871/m.133566 type:complete len:689 (+) Transcript_52871:88-2154(+)
MPGEGGGVPKGGNRSNSTRTVELKVMGTTETMELPAMICTRVGEVKELLAEKLLVDVEQLAFYYKAGSYVTVQKDWNEIQTKTLVKGVRSFKPQAHTWPHPIGIIGSGYHGLKTGLTYLKDGNSNIVMFDRNDKVGGYCWITAANKHSKLQTEFGSFHVWWGEEMITEKCGFPSKDWGIWPRKEKVLEHFQWAAEQYGVLPNIRFRCNVATLDIVGDKNALDRYYALGVKSLDDDSSDIVKCSVLYNYPGSMTKNRIIDYPGEEDFDGYIGYGMNDDCPYEHLEGNKIAILGNGAFAVENCRTAIEYGCEKVYLVTRRKNLASPRIPCWFVHQGPIPTPGALVLKMFEPMYELVGFGDPWEYWSVHANSDRTKVNIIQNSRFGIGDVTFLAVACGKLEYVEDTLKRCARHTLHLTNGRKLEDVKVILKSLGLLGDYEVDRLHKMKKMVGSYCDGDWRRVLMIDATGMNAANFTTFSTGIGTKGFVFSHKYLHDHPREYDRIAKEGYIQQLPVNEAREKEDKPAYVTDVKYSMSAGIIMSGYCPAVDQDNQRDPIYKHRMYHAAHPVELTLETVKKEWDEYQAKWKAQGCTADYVPYPYTREMIDGYFKEYSKLLGIEVYIDGRTDHWPAELSAVGKKEKFGSVPAWHDRDESVGMAQKAIDSDHLKWWGGMAPQGDRLQTNQKYFGFP